MDLFVGSALKNEPPVLAIPLLQHWCLHFVAGFETFLKVCYMLEALPMLW